MEKKIQKRFRKKQGEVIQVMSEVQHTKRGYVEGENLNQTWA